VENLITQPAKFKVGQRVVVTPDYDRPYATLRAVVTEVEKGEEDWKFYVRYEVRDCKGRQGGLFFAEEIQALKK
jgi:hypothetical protein